MEENTQVEEVQEDVAEEAQTTEDTTDWKAEAKKWEKRAKENKAARDELDALKAESMTEGEKLKARAEAAEQELGQLKAAAARTSAAQEIANATGVPMELLLFCEDRDAMETFAEKYQAANEKPPAAPKASGSRISKGVPEAQLSNREKFAQMLGAETN